MNCKSDFICEGDVPEARCVISKYVFCFARRHIKLESLLNWSTSIVDFSVSIFLGKKAQFMFLQVFISTNAAAEKGLRCFSICFANCRPRTTQSLPCVLNSLVQTPFLVSWFFPCSILILFLCSADKLQKLIWIWRQKTDRKSHF